MNIFKRIKSWFQIKEEPYTTSRVPKDDMTKNQIDIRHHKLILEPNSLLDNRVVLYFERSNNPVINNYIRRNYDYLQKSLSKKGMTLIHIPSKEISPANRLLNNELVKHLCYKYPHIFTGTLEEVAESAGSIIKNLDLQLYYNYLGDLLGIPGDQAPCFIHSIDFETVMSDFRKWEYSCFYLSPDNEEVLKRQIDFYLAHTRIPENPVFFSLRNRDKDNYDADEQFDFDGNKISPDIQIAIDKINSITNEKLLIASIMHLIKNLKNTNPAVCERISKSLLNKIDNQPQKCSRIIIDEQFRIWLPEYNNIEIELTPLPKAFYIFMLKHPEGISFKHLSEYKNELLEIYKRIANRDDLEKVRQSINDIVDIRSNSVNEKCSRIKEAFLSKIDDSIAKNYYITGGRNKLKSIVLDNALIHFPKNL
jgi:nitrogen regulatory protein PII-like uncharacterized protein